jgi:hypothetical protein
MMTDIASQRLWNQHLIGKPLPSPEVVVRWLGAVQSQDYLGAKWGIAQRTTGTTSGAIDELFNAGGILRTHVLRPTWHFVAPDDIRWMLELTRPRVHAVNAHYYRKLELDDETLRRSSALLANELAGGNFRTRKELAVVLEIGGISATGPRLGYLMMYAELEGLICSGPLRGKQFTYALLDERAPLSPGFARDEALAELTVRYFSSHGPATVRDFGWWSGLTIAEGKRGIATAGDRLTSRNVGDETFWFTGESSFPEVSPPIAHLLPNYDEFLVAYKDHVPSFDPMVYANLDPESDILFAHILSIDGFVVGGWRRSIGRAEAVISVTLLRQLSEAERVELANACDRFGAFMKLPTRLEFTTRASGGSA